ncbi:DUF3408 domain-containing protein [Bacteroides thetaiotaomicron]|uniref:DUF3408 domain-containing protein n=1 Tax=Bacteroides thetaiotaomicron TaxID=818 RepID=UPI001C01AD14|nr:DUF3408 domain-containing protein [Bacteroides thetaiotaomicron]MBT9900953.1 DUF3408 domain-containing protein [Bacteroides thetaiotaomicron]
MAKKREIFKVDEDVLKDMMASESISCGKSGGDVGGNVVSPAEKGQNVLEIEKLEQEKSRKTIRADPGLEKKVEMYRELFLDKRKSVHRKQTYISYDMYCKLARILPLLSDDMSVPAFLDNVLAHHLETYSKELGELFRRKTQEPF